MGPASAGQWLSATRSTIERDKYVFAPDSMARRGSVQIGTQTICTFKATGTDTHGHFGLFEYAMAPGAEGEHSHLYKRLTQMFYVAEGEVELHLEQRRVTASPSTFILFPQGTPRGFSNPGSRRSKLPSTRAKGTLKAWQSSPATVGSQRTRRSWN